MALLEALRLQARNTRSSAESVISEDRFSVSHGVTETEAINWRMAEYDFPHAMID